MRNNELYRDVLEGILAYTEGRRVMTRREVARYLNKSERTVARMFPCKDIAVERLARYLT